MCTIFSVFRNSSVYFCNNEDNIRAADETFIAFLPSQTIPSEWIFPETKDVINTYGTVLLGVREGDILYPQGGMNEHGLAFDINYLPEISFKGIEGKPWRRGFNFFDLLMINKDIPDILKHYQSYHQSARQWGAGQLHYADAKGNAIVIGINKDGTFGFTSRDNGEFLISTNFNLLNPVGETGYPCQRYNIAEEMLEELVSKELIVIEDLVQILDAVKLEFGILGPNTGTVYSNICDLRSKEFYLYHYSDFSEARKFNLKRKFQEEYTNKHEYIFADTAEKERFSFEKIQLFIIEDLF